MNFKFIASIILVVGGLSYFEIEPSDLLEQGSEVWEEFTGDFAAIFNGEAEKKISGEIGGTSNRDLQEICDADPAAEGDEAAMIVRNINLERCEAIRNAKATIANPEELKQRLEDQDITIEDLKKRLEDSRKLLE
jgi:putative NADH-flavin reductase